MLVSNLVEEVRLVVIIDGIHLVESKKKERKKEEEE